jgi:hypothetical protein
MFTGWNTPMTMKHTPAKMADKPAKCMRVDAVTFILFSLIAVWRWVFMGLFPSWFVVLLLMFICLFPFLNVLDEFD